tara:strand:+ start:1831 stop:2817 length:987 start_codon:yes stop_codon:yes gene_type:complete
LSKIKYSVGCASGTDALILALKSINLQKDDEIIIPAMTYISTGLAVILNNCKIIFADIDEKTGLISITKVLKSITKKTKVIIPVNLYGQKVDIKKLRKTVGRKIFIIEDSAQSHFAYSCYYCDYNANSKCCKKERNERFANVACYSFYPSKNLGAYGDAGLVATNDFKIYKKLLSLRNLGAVKKNEHNIIGMSSRLDTIQAVVLKNKLKSILKLNDIRRKISIFYDKSLRNIKEIKITETNPGSSRHLYVIRTKYRNKLLKYLLMKKINCQIHYPYSLNKAKFINKKITLKNSENWANQCLSLPLHPNLKIFQMRRIVSEIKNFFQYK